MTKLIESYDDFKKVNEEDLKQTNMFHCDAKSCEHYLEKSGTTNCTLKEISISAKGGCNQYEPVGKE